MKHICVSVSVVITACGEHPISTTPLLFLFYIGSRCCINYCEHSQSKNVEGIQQISHNDVINIAAWTNGISFRKDASTTNGQGIRKWNLLFVISYFVRYSNVDIRSKKTLFSAIAVSIHWHWLGAHYAFFCEPLDSDKGEGEFHEFPPTFSHFFFEFVWPWI